MATRQYIGARYVPVFADPVQWSDDRTYEPLMMVQSAGETYITKQATPIGAQLPNISQGEEDNEFWVHMSNWNAQIEQYREEVLQYNGRISALELKFDANGDVEANLVNTASIEDNAVTTAKIADENVTTAKIADENVTTAKIADEAVTAAKLADGAVTASKIANNAITLANSSYKHMVVIGDSFSTTTYCQVESAWYTLLAKTLGLTVHNYAKNSAGYVKVGDDSSTFMTEAQRAVADTDYDNDDVKLVVVYGGLNDMNTDYVGDLSSNANSLYAYLKSNFENALVVVFGINHWPSGLWHNPNSTTSTSNYSYNLSVKAKDNSCVYIPIWHLMWDAGYFNPSHNHPNDAGNRFTASIMLDLMFGGAVGAFNELTKTGTDADGNTYTVHMRMLNNEIRYYGKYNLLSTTKAYITPPNNLYTASNWSVQGIPTVSGTDLIGWLNTNSSQAKNAFIGFGTQGREYFYNFSLPILG